MCAYATLFFSAAAAATVVLRESDKAAAVLVQGPSSLLSFLLRQKEDSLVEQVAFSLTHAQAALDLHAAQRVKEKNKARNILV